MERREFLMAAAAPMMAASDTVRLGFIGLGSRGTYELEICSRTPGAHVVAVADVYQPLVDKAVAFRQAKAAGYQDFRRLLERKDIDAVFVSTPDHWHAPAAILACQAGKDVLCEKPLSHTLHEGQTMVKAARKYDRVFQTGSQQRSAPHFKKVVELIQKRHIGKVAHVECWNTEQDGPEGAGKQLDGEPLEGLDWDLYLGPAPKVPYNRNRYIWNYRWFWDYSGGMMTDWGAHHFDIAQWGLGMDESGPVEIIPPEDPKATMGVRYVYANGIEVIHNDQYEKGKHVDGVAFIGTEGKIFVNRGKLTISDPTDRFMQPPGDKEVSLYKSSGQQKDWLNCIKSRKRPICDVEIGARSVTVCHLGNLAYWNHRKLRWDPKEWRFIDDAEAQKWLDRERREGYSLPTV